MKLADLRGLSKADLSARIREQKEALSKMQFTHAVTMVENPAKIRETRRGVAQMMTVLREMELKENA